MTEQEVREHRLMVFTSLLRTLDFVSHARVTQCYTLFKQYIKENPLIDGYTRTGHVIDHTNMKLFVDNLKGDLEPSKPRPDWVISDVKLPNTHRITVESDDPRIKEL